MVIGQFGHLGPAVQQVAIPELGQGYEPVTIPHPHMEDSIAKAAITKRRIVMLSNVQVNDFFFVKLM